jgi:hypothetical protein
VKQFLYTVGTTMEEKELDLAEGTGLVNIGTMNFGDSVQRTSKEMTSKDKAAEDEKENAKENTVDNFPETSPPPVSSLKKVRVRRTVRFSMDYKERLKNMNTDEKQRNLLRVSLTEKDSERLKEAIDRKAESASGLEKLYISKSHRVSTDMIIPRSILEHTFRLKNLTVLSLRRLLLSKIPKQFSEFVHLKALCLSYNSLRVWPEPLSHMVSLEKLWLDNNMLEVPPEFEIGRLKNLRFLSLSNNNLSFCPSEISFLKNLEKLFLDGNQLDRIPLQLEPLDRLTELSLERNKIKGPDKLAIGEGAKSVRTLLKYRSKHMKSLTMKLRKEKEERRALAEAKKHLAESKRDRFDQPQYKDQYHTGSLLRRAYLTSGIDLRRYNTKRLPDCLFEHSRVIEHVVIDNTQIAHDIIDFEDGRPSIRLKSIYEFLYACSNLTTIKIYAKDRKSFFDVVNKFSRNIKVVFDLVNERSVVPQNLGAQMCWKFIVYKRPTP